MIAKSDRGDVAVVAQSVSGGDAARGAPGVDSPRVQLAIWRSDLPWPVRLSVEATDVEFTLAHFQRHGYLTISKVWSAA